MNNNDNKKITPLFLVKAIIDIDDYLRSKGKNIDDMNCLLVDYNNKSTFSIINYDEDKAIFYRFKNNEDPEISYSYDWDFSYDNSIFYYLENNYEIKTIRMDVHYDIWCTINELYPEDIINKKGLNKYINYCRENKITKKVRDEFVKIDTPDIMKLFKKERER